MITLKCNLENITEIVDQINSLIRADSSNIIILNGDLSSGKTTLVKEYAKRAGLSIEQVTSPTFSIMQKYSQDIYHYDIYSKGSDAFLSLGLLEECEKSGVHFIEWGDDKLKCIFKSLDFYIIEIAIVYKGKFREYIIKCMN